MRQRTLGIVGAVLLIAGIAVNVGTDIAAHQLSRGVAVAPLQGHRHHAPFGPPMRNPGAGPGVGAPRPQYP